jgi:hypothetical protein
MVSFVRGITPEEFSFRGTRADQNNVLEPSTTSASGTRDSINLPVIGFDSAALARSQDYGKSFQAPQSECRSPLRPRASKLHLGEALHQIQDRNLSL